MRFSVISSCIDTVGSKHHVEEEGDSKSQTNGLLQQRLGRRAGAAWNLVSDMGVIDDSRDARSSSKLEGEGSKTVALGLPSAEDKRGGFTSDRLLGLTPAAPSHCDLCVMIFSAFSGGAGRWFGALWKVVFVFSNEFWVEPTTLVCRGNSAPFPCSNLYSPVLFSVPLFRWDLVVPSSCFRAVSVKARFSPRAQLSLASGLLPFSLAVHSSLASAFILVGWSLRSLLWLRALLAFRCSLLPDLAFVSGLLCAASSLGFPATCVRLLWFLQLPACNLSYMLLFPTI